MSHGHLLKYTFHLILILIHIFNKTGTHQCTWAIWSIFADIHSTRCIDALFRVTGISGYLWYLIYSMVLILSFCSCVYMYIHGMCYITTWSTWARRVLYNHEVWKTSAYSLKCVLKLLGPFGVHLLTSSELKPEIPGTPNSAYLWYLIYPMIAISENTWSFDYFWHSVGL